MTATRQPRREPAPSGLQLVKQNLSDLLLATVSLDALRSSAVTVASQHDPNVVNMSPNGQTSEGGFRAIVATDGYDTYSVRKMNFWSAGSWHWRRTSGATQRRTERTGRARRSHGAVPSGRGIKLDLAIAPFHADYLDGADAAGLWLRYELAKKQSDFCWSPAKATDSARLWDFLGYDTYATQPFGSLIAPAAHVGSGTSHFKGVLGEKILATIYREGQDSGVRLDARYDRCASASRYAGESSVSRPGSRFAFTCCPRDTVMARTSRRSPVRSRDAASRAASTTEPDRGATMHVATATHGETTVRSSDPLFAAAADQAGHVPQSDHEHQPCLHAGRGRHAEGALPALPRGESEGRHRADHVWRILDGFSRFKLGRRPDLCVGRCDHPLSARIFARHSRPWRGDHVPDLASRPACRRDGVELAADGRPSPIRETRHRNFPREMDAHDIARIVKEYAAAAKRCQEGGLDGVER